MIDSATRGSRWLFLAFSEVSPVHIRSRSPSRPTQTGTLCGDPSGITVERCAKLGASTKDLMSSESRVGILILRSNFTAQRREPQFSPRIQDKSVVQICQAVSTFCMRLL